MSCQFCDRQGSYNPATIRPFFQHQGRNARNGGKINMLAKKELSIRRKQSTITNYSKQVKNTLYKLLTFMFLLLKSYMNCYFLFQNLEKVVK